MGNNNSSESSSEFFVSNNKLNQQEQQQEQQQELEQQQQGGEINLDFLDSENMDFENFLQQNQQNQQNQKIINEIKLENELLKDKNKYLEDKISKLIKEMIELKTILQNRV